jgi:hypothetical protein
MITEDIKNKFCNDVISWAVKNDGSYIDATISVSEDYGFGPEMGAKLSIQTNNRKNQNRGTGD